MTTLYVNDDGLGEECVGTRAEFKEALADLWPTWFEDYRNSHEAEHGEYPECTLDEYIEQSLDDCLNEATEDDIARLTAAGMRL